MSRMCKFWSSKGLELGHSKLPETDRDRQRQTETDTDRQTETDRDRQRQTETDRDRQKQTETDRETERQRDKQTHTETAAPQEQSPMNTHNQTSHTMRQTQTHHVCLAIG